MEENRCSRTPNVVMTAIDCILDILNTKLPNENLRYCLVTKDKHPIQLDGTPAKPNSMIDFSTFDDLIHAENLNSYAGVGVSIQASNICAIDVDKCFKVPLDINSADERAKDIIERFKDFAYCEFSFSGTGLRVLFRAPIIKNYSDLYYIKNESNQIEFYQPSKSYRYVTITGKAIVNNKIEFCPSYILDEFLNIYMKKPERKTFISQTNSEEVHSFDELKILVKKFYFKNQRFQNLWFGQAPGSGKNESELDYELLAQMYEQITQDKDLLRQLFETSPYFKSKDWKHINKWNNQEYRYFNYIYEQIRRTHV